ncbi:hypothetical protein CJ97_gp13 [Ralstonia phage RSB2]|uniref:Uncharacterized protein ORF13 n=1 Tax=Ralstonia phage RSB2 TaxID=913183 RepID=E5RUZ3_9CAUD|nr:hypothetical protein CJ97_gp13 [Ralstonia phage RSB2]BAJ51801.1 hypothetical protein [Ralstonia phage RSB2]
MVSIEQAIRDHWASLTPAQRKEHIDLMVNFHHVKEQRAMRITSQVNTLNEYRAAFFVKALRQLARKVGLELAEKTTAQSVCRLLADTYDDRFGYKAHIPSPHLSYLDFSTKDGRLLRSLLDPVHLFHVFNGLAQTPHTQQQELVVLGEHALRIIRQTVDHGLRDTLEAITKEAR